MWRQKRALGESLACLVFLVTLADAYRFLNQSTASQFLSRHRRANSLFEESKKGDLERECIEELCNKEEAREIFENHPETEYFYPKYVACLGSHRVGITNQNSEGIPSDLRTCVKEISNQCTPFPCYKEGTERCVDGQASFKCVCKTGWKGPRCEDDIDECSDPEYPAGCNHKCSNLPGSFHCMCEEGYVINNKINCFDINECLLYPSICGEPARCVNTPGMYECQCPLGFKYNFTSKSCNEGVVLYAESSQDSWFMLGLRGGRIEVQFKNQHTFKVTTGGKAINDGQWHVISVDELESSISVKISKEAVMSINSPESLFTSVNGIQETKVYIAGLPNRTDNVIKPGASGVKEVIQEKKSKHCFVYVERGSFFTGLGLAHFNIDYSDSGSWNVDIKMSILPSSSTGVLFALVYNNTVPLSVAVVTQGEQEANLQVFLEGVSVATLDSLMLCYPDRLTVQLNVTATGIQISANSSSVTYMNSEALAGGPGAP
ncbi:Vitamin K-dependent protein S [Larimichthys crocea]|uniref:Uncharacterized protein n=1 Tax=Larimichthys crocea TaxID=215358 RepID=A0ACD3R1A7_LARCR|nr:Vitamin K-dependent protein S [Larimichthys crocea]